jgi:hypothetical protein
MFWPLAQYFYSYIATAIARFAVVVCVCSAVGAVSRVMNDLRQRSHRF